MQTLSVVAKDVEEGPMKATSAGQNSTQAVQDGFYRGLLGNSTRHIEQRSISTVCCRHLTCI
jgi:hypothetical protein